MEKIDVVDVVPRRAAVVRRLVAMAEMPRAQREARTTLHAAVGAVDASALGPRLTVWRPPSNGAIDYAPGVFVPDGFEASGGVTIFALPLGRAVHLRLEGLYDGLPKAWQKLFAACATQGLTTAGLNWEVYAVDGARPQTDLYALLA